MNSPPVLEPILVGIGRFTGGTTWILTPWSCVLGGSKTSKPWSTDLRPPAVFESGLRQGVGGDEAEAAEAAGDQLSLLGMVHQRHLGWFIRVVHSGGSFEGWLTSSAQRGSRMHIFFCAVRNEAKIIWGVIKRSHIHTYK